MEELREKLKVYCETSFWSYLNGGRTPLEHIAVKQAATLKWWRIFLNARRSSVMDDDIITIDPIEEIYAIRQRISARYGHDPRKLSEAMVERQRIAVAKGRKVVSFASPAYPSIPADTGVLRACESAD